MYNVPFLAVSFQKYSICKCLAKTAFALFFGDFWVRVVLFEIANLVRDRKITPLHFPPFKVSCDIKSIWSVFDILKHFFLNILNVNKKT